VSDATGGTGEHRREILETLLDEELHFGATTVRGLTNHLPMALVAKAALGAPDEELRRFSDTYRRRLAVVTAPRTRLTTATWRSSIGRRGSYEELRDYFGRYVEIHGTHEALREHVSELVPGIYGAAFHGALRLSYALEVSSPARVAAGLAYLAEHAVPVPGATSVKRANGSLMEAFSTLERAGVTIAGDSRQLISQEMQAAGLLREFWPAIADVQITSHTPEELRALALRLYATTDDFTSLHAVTGMAALAGLRAYVEDTAAFDRACLVGVAAAYVSIGVPPLDTDADLAAMGASTNVSVSDIAGVGAMSDDEHVSKLIFSSLQLHEATGDELYLTVAARKAGLTERGGAS